MKVTIASTATGCTISKVEFHQSTRFPLPIMAGDLSALLSSLLADPDKREVEQGPVQIVRTEAGVSIRTSAWGTNGVKLRMSEKFAHRAARFRCNGLQLFAGLVGQFVAPTDDVHIAHKLALLGIAHVNNPRHNAQIIRGI